MCIRIDIDSLPDVITFCRHVESTGNASGKDDNSTLDIANHQFTLSEKGYAQRQDVRRFLLHGHPDEFTHYYVSTFLRPHLTFEGIFPNIVPYEDPRLDEWWKGIFHSLTQEQIEQHYPIESSVLQREGWYHYRPPQGEAGKDVELRILSFLDSLKPSDSPFICGHGRWFCFFERLLCGYSRDEMRTAVPKNGSIIRFQKSGTYFTSQVLFTPQ